MAEVSLSPFVRNTTGQARPADYKLGRGAMHFSELTAADVPTGGWQFVGNCPAVSCDLSREYLEHFSSISGVREQDARIPISSSLSVRFSFEEVNEANAAIYLSSTPEAYTNVAIAGFSEHTMVASLTQGRRYEILNASGAKAYGIDSGDLTVKRSSDDTPGVLGTDFLVDEAEGEILIVQESSVLTDGEGLKVTLAAAAGADTMRQIPILNRTTFDVSLKFFGESAATGRKFELWIPKASIAADGAVDLVTAQDLAQFPLVATALKRTGYALGYLKALPAAVN